MCNCDCHSEINRDGSGQLGRYLKALDPDNAPVDARNLNDLLVFIQGYADQVRFYDIPGSMVAAPATSPVPGTSPAPGTSAIPATPATPGAAAPDPAKLSWEEFFRRDMAVIAASIGVTDLSAIKMQYDQLRANVDAAPTAANFSLLFPPVMSIMNILDGWYSLAIPDNPLKQDLTLAIASALKPQVTTLMGYEMGFRIVDPASAINLDFSAIANPDIWNVHGTVTPDTSIYDGDNENDRILNGALYIDDIFLAFYGVISNLVDNSDKYLQFALEQYPSHQPHMALFLAFLQLFRVAQQQLNGLTEKMLDFYYREVLQLPAKPSIPDKAYIVFQLAQDVAGYDLVAGTPLKAGKDVSGKDLVYVTENDFVVNQATVAELKNFFIDKGAASGASSAGAVTGAAISGFYARPVANSQDGFGAAITDASGKWPVFGKGSLLNNLPGNPCDLVDEVRQEMGRQDAVSIGFAIASPQLLLQGGKRIIRMSVKGLDSLFQETGETPGIVGADGTIGVATEKVIKTVKVPFQIALSGEKGWLNISRLMSAEQYKQLSEYLPAGIINPAAVITDSCLFLDIATESLLIYLPASEKAIIAYDPSLHTGSVFPTSYPVMQVLLTPQALLNETNMLQLKTNNLQLEIRVGSVLYDTNYLNSNKIDVPPDALLSALYLDGLPVLTLQNDDGPITPGKPFDPFTAYPDLGKSLYIGSDEVFNKPLGGLAVNIRFNYDRAGVKVLDTGFVPGVAGLAGVDREAAVAVSVREQKAWTDVVPYSYNSNYGFSRATLRDNILYTPGVAAADGSLPKGTPLALPRTPVEEADPVPDAADKGWLRISYMRNTNGDFTMQQSQALAAALKISALTVNYSSLLTRLDASVDQLFHIYPFGVAEIFLGYASDVAVARRNVLKPAVTAQADRFLNKAAHGFTRLYTEKGGLLVDAQQKLFPQFTYTSPYSVFDQSAPQPVVSKDAVVKKLATLSVQSATAPRGFDPVKVVGYGAGIHDQQSAINQYSGQSQEEGQLFIGIKDVAALETVSLLFQFAEGSAVDEDDDPPPINWSYLNYNEWKPLPGTDLVRDSTFGFQATGIVAISLPEDANDHHSIMTDGLFWLCASVSGNANRIPQLIAVMTQATEVAFQDNGNDRSHFDKALPAGSIGKLATPVQEISKVQQPFASFDGKAAEIGRQYYTRVSERLRHKHRAITAWDYEHLILDRFPGIYKVKCIPHTDPNCLCRHGVAAGGGAAAGSGGAAVTGFGRASLTGSSGPGANVAAPGSLGTLSADKAEALLENAFRRLANKQPEGHAGESCCGPQVAPGHVLVVPISDMNHRNAVNPLQPKTARLTLIEIEQYLQTLVSPFVKVHAKNPVYEEIIVAFRVKFYEGYDIGYYLKQLNQEIVEYLTPWAFDANADVVFGQKVYASSIINFIEKRPYVDFITDFFMAVCREECCPGKHREPVKPADIGMPNASGTPNAPATPGTQVGGVPSPAGAPATPAAATPKGSLTPEQMATALSNACGCEEVLYLIIGKNKFKGEIVAAPSGPRSILVSVQQHIIVPYEEPPYLSPCEKRKLSPAPQPQPVPPVKGDPPQPASSQPASPQPSNDPNNPH